MLQQFKDWLGKHPSAQIAFGLWTIAAPFLGYFSSEFISVRAQQRSALNTDYIAAQQASLSVQKRLLDLAPIANGHGKKSEAKVASLRGDIQALYAASRQVSERLPAVKSDFDAYADAMAELQTAAEQLNDASDTPHFTEVVSKYIWAQNNFNSDVVGAQTCYWSCIFSYKPPKHSA